MASALLNLSSSQSRRGRGRKRREGEKEKTEEINKKCEKENMKDERKRVEQ